jgi:hypothetical protein
VEKGVAGGVGGWWEQAGLTARLMYVVAVEKLLLPVEWVCSVAASLVV